MEEVKDMAHDVQQTVEQVIHEPTLMDWIELWMPAILVFLSKIIPAYIGYLTVKARVNKHNDERKQRYHEEHRDEEYEDHTALEYFRRDK